MTWAAKMAFMNEMAALICQARPERPGCNMRGGATGGGLGVYMEKVGEKRNAWAEKMAFMNEMYCADTSGEAWTTRMRALRCPSLAPPARLAWMRCR